MLGADAGQVFVTDWLRYMTKYKLNTVKVQVVRFLDDTHEKEGFVFYHQKLLAF